MTGAEKNMRGFLATYSANRHLRAYLLERDPKHIGRAWAAFRKHKHVAPDEAMLAWVDVLADAVLNPAAPGARGRENLARDLDIWWQAEALKRKHRASTLTKAMCEGIGRIHRMKVPAVRTIVSRVEHMFADPFYEPKAYR